jgi:signal transduction histidine kinase
MSKSLQQKNTRYLLTWLPLVMLLGSLFFYWMMSGHVHHMQEQQLQLKQENIWKAFQSAPKGIAFHIKGEYDIEKGTPVLKDGIDRSRDTILYYEDSKKWDAFKILTRQYRFMGDPYQLTTYISSKEITHLIIKVSIAEALIFILLLSAVVFINRKSSGLLWKPFYNTMGEVKEYDIIKNKSLILPPQTGIEEFDQLNQTIVALIEHVNRAYNNQKQFVENASHELQTPLAIIRSKVELLIDSAGLTEETAGLLTDITDANDRLSQMNKNLLLLAKIDNYQFPEQHTVPLSNLLGKLITQYQEHYEGDVPAIKTTIQPDVELQANSALIEILINNLVRNSIVHNLPGGYVDIRLAGRELTIENSGPVLEGDTERLFERFKKGREESRTTGLGLALVRQICHVYRFDLQYHHHQGVHRIRVNFGKPGFLNSSQIDS